MQYDSEPSSGRWLGCGAVPWSPWMSAAECLIRKQKDQLSLAEWLSVGDDDNCRLDLTRWRTGKSRQQMCKGKIVLRQSLCAPGDTLQIDNSRRLL